MTKRLIFIALLLAGIASAIPGAAQTNNQPEYRLLAAVRAATLEKELNEAAQQGYRLEKVSQWIGIASLAALMSRPAGTAPAQRFEYRTVSLKQFEQQKDELLKQGFDYRALLTPSLFSFNSAGAIMLLEREGSGSAVPYEYELIQSGSESKLQTLLDNASSGGFVPAGMLLAQGHGTVVVMRRDRTNPAAEMGKREYRLLSTRKVSTLEKEMNQAAQEGFRCALSSQGQNVLMARDYKPRDQARYEYKLVGLGRSENSSEKTLNELVKQGCVFRGTTTYGLTVIFERQAGAAASASSIEFRVLTTRSEATMQKEIQSAVAQGFLPLSLSGSSGNFIAILRREVNQGN
ncbi:MAG TPA: hypothetical protein VNQ79_20785 [Blastocatellia bacterium]|nr:hypothetical protein [Blastocatellia bacterium]